jgi:hypothetical protein
MMPTVASRRLPRSSPLRGRPSSSLVRAKLHRSSHSLQAGASSRQTTILRPRSGSIDLWPHLLAKPRLPGCLCARPMHLLPSILRPRWSGPRKARDVRTGAANGGRDWGQSGGMRLWCPLGGKWEMVGRWQKGRTGGRKTTEGGETKGGKKIFCTEPFAANRLCGRAGAGCDACVRLRGGGNEAL